MRQNAGVDELMQQQPNYRGAAPVTAVTAQGNQTLSLQLLKLYLF